MSQDKNYLDDDMRPSKSERKREVHALTDLGKQLVDMTPNQLADLPVSEELIDAIKTARKIRNKHAGFNRQIQYIGKLIRSTDPQPIIDAIEARQQAHLHEQKHFHSLEQWRDRLVAEGDRKSTRLNSSHVRISYAVFCLKTKPSFLLLVLH